MDILRWHHKNHCARLHHARQQTMSLCEACRAPLERCETCKRTLYPPVPYPDAPEPVANSITISYDRKMAGAVAAAPPSEKSPSEHFERFEMQDAAWRAAASKKLLRKIDSRLIPVLVLMYLLNFLDRSNLAQARQGSLEKDLGMTGTDFNLATSIFFVGYLLMQLPSNMLITRVRPSRYLALATGAWGLVSASNALTHNFKELLVVRFLLGFVEAPFFPGSVFLLSSWYTRAELTRRMAWFYSAISLANMFGGVMGASILGNLEGARGVAGWRWLFVIEGGITVAVAAVAPLILPDYPRTTKWLTPEEREFASWRLLDDLKEADESRLKASLWDGVKMALGDYRTYLFVLLQHTAILALTFQYFFPSIVGTLGYGAIETLWLTCPVWFATFLVSVAVTWSSAKTRDRSLHIMALMMVAAAGNALATGTKAVGPRFFAMFLMPMGAIAAYQIVLSWIANSFPRPLVKRSAVIAIANMIGNTASIYGSYMYPSKDAPQFLVGGSINAAVCVVVAAVAFVLRRVHQKENAKLARAEREAALLENRRSGEDVEGGKVRGFRYVY